MYTLETSLTIISERSIKTILYFHMSKLLSMKIWSCFVKIVLFNDCIFKVNPIEISHIKATDNYICKLSRNTLRFSVLSVIGFSCTVSISELFQHLRHFTVNQRHKVSRFRVHISESVCFVVLSHFFAEIIDFQIHIVPFPPPFPVVRELCCLRGGRGE